MMIDIVRLAAGRAAFGPSSPFGLGSSSKFTGHAALRGQGLAFRNLLQTKHDGSVHGAIPTGNSLGADRIRFYAWTNRRDCQRSTAVSAAFFFSGRGAGALRLARRGALQPSSVRTVRPTSRRAAGVSLVLAPDICHRQLRQGDRLPVQ